MSKHPPPALTANAGGPCPTIIQIVGCLSTGSLPRAITPPNHPQCQKRLSSETIHHSIYYQLRYQLLTIVSFIVIGSANNLGPVVQSIISLTSSLRGQLKTVFNLVSKYIDILCWKNVRSFCSAKASHIFSTKKYWGISDIGVWNFNKTPWR